MNIKNLLYEVLLYCVLLSPITLQSLEKVPTAGHKSQPLQSQHPDIIIKHIKNATDHPIKVVLRSKNITQDVDTFQTIQPHTKEKANIHLEYNTKDNAYAQLGFRWLKPDAPEAKETKTERDLISYTPSGHTRQLNITLVEDRNNPGNLKIVKYVQLHKKHKKHPKHNNRHKKQKHTNKHGHKSDKQPTAVA